MPILDSPKPGCQTLCMAPLVRGEARALLPPPRPYPIPTPSFGRTENKAGSQGSTQSQRDWGWPWWLSTVAGEMSAWVVAHCPPAAGKPTMSRFRRKGCYFSMSHFHANYVNTFGKKGLHQAPDSERVLKSQSPAQDSQPRQPLAP